MGATYSNDDGCKVIICNETKSGCCGINPPEFDSAEAKNSVQLNRIIGGSFEQFSQEVERKFSEANEQLKTLYINPWYWFGPLFLFMVGFTASLLGFSVYAGKRKQRGEPLEANDPNFIFGVSATFIFLFLTMGMIFPIARRTHQKNKDVKQILQDNFSDWNAKGVEIEYHPMDDTENGYLKLILRPSSSLV